MTPEERRKHFSDMLFEQWSNAAKAYARPRERVKSKEAVHDKEEDNVKR